MEQGISTLAAVVISPPLPSSAPFAPAMMAAWALVALGLCALAALVYVAIRSRARRVDLETAIATFRALDIEAFRNLVDPREEAFLRDHLSSAKFRRIQRQRAWVAFLYTHEAGNAATALAMVGQTAQRSSDPRIAASGAQLAENAFRLRLQTTVASLRLLTGILLPGLLSHSLPSLADQYEQSTETLVRLRRFSSRMPAIANSETA